MSDNLIKRLLMSTFAALFIGFMILLVIMANVHANDRQACKDKGGVPVLMRDGILCLPAGSVIPLR